MDPSNNESGTADQEQGVEFYADPGIASYDKPVPTFLKWTYCILPIWGIISCYIFFNGSLGWFDRGYWHELQIAANTTVPYHDSNFPVYNENLQKDEISYEEEIE